ncbi:MAG: hypothetical protein EAZ84_04115 [Verrucomicrobia bacterium]|nr:MAG: hypothetical protein EAZ84_04115 [Verrucomicrobiota bacterium]TAE86497.1 MAG: hypothetical protein EAZ82_10710 [Verrucomicrobiota bacterium]TAF24133.1 MAG: hypothetical protein EAZ71_11180 [Verrucomicrobiota bacterium]
MSWIQENRFAAGLGGITTAAAAGLIFWGLSAGSKYDEAKDAYASAADAVSQMEGEKLYPNDDNRQAKKKAVEEYADSVEALQKSFKGYTTPTPALVEPSAFTESLLKAKDIAAKSFSNVGCELPPEFFLGFEAYTNSPVKKEATGILAYQMEGISNLLGSLADSAPAKLINVHRPALLEEEGQVFDVKGKTFRALPVEISFTSTEASLRKFLSSLDDSKKFYYVVRSIRVMNEKSKAPTAADSQFQAEEDAGSEEAESSPSDTGGFVFPGDEDSAEAPAPDAAEKSDGEKAPVKDEGVILQQVLGSEKIHVFLRIDILQFLDASKA